MTTLPTFEMPTFDVGSFTLPTLPDRAELSELPTQIAGAARDAAYIGVGLVVMGVERVQTAAGQVQAFGEQVGQTVADLVSSGVEQARTAFSTN